MVINRCHKCAIEMVAALVAFLPVFSASAADPDITGLVPTIWWDFETQPDAAGLSGANKGSAAISFTSVR